MSTSPIRLRAEFDETTRRTLGDLSVLELLRTAERETLAFGHWLDKHGVEDVLANAYIGSIAARISVARTKLEGVL